jgi:hypothetical protein
MNFGSLHYFLGIKRIKNDLNRQNSVGLNPARGYSARIGGLPRAAGRKGRLGHGLAARSSRGGGPRTEQGGHRAWDGAVARSPRARGG